MGIVCPPCRTCGPRLVPQPSLSASPSGARFQRVRWHQHGHVLGHLSQMRISDLEVHVAEPLAVCGASPTLQQAGITRYLRETLVPSECVVPVPPPRKRARLKLVLTTDETAPTITWSAVSLTPGIPLVFSRLLAGVPAVAELHENQPNSTYVRPNNVRSGHQQVSCPAGQCDSWSLFPSCARGGERLPRSHTATIRPRLDVRR